MVIELKIGDKFLVLEDHIFFVLKGTLGISTSGICVLIFFFIKKMDAKRVLVKGVVQKYIFYIISFHIF